MATQTYRIVSSEDSDLHDEPHIEGSRITVRYVREQVEERGLDPETVANRHALDVSRVYEALAYYHSNPEVMRRIEKRHQRAITEAKRRSSLSLPEE